MGNSPRNTSKRPPGAQVEDLERKLRSSTSNLNQKMSRKHDSAQREKDLFQSPRSIQRNRKLAEKFKQGNAAFELPQADSDKFFNAKMHSIEDLIGPQFCSLCDRNITQSVKIRSKEHDSVGSSGKPIIICLECHKSGVTIG